jgi:ATP-dependent DNA helicase RecG
LTPDQLTALATTGESDTLEFKRSTGGGARPCTLLRAMLNHRGGRVLFGVAPNGSVLGRSADGSIEWKDAQGRTLKEQQQAEADS